MEDLDLEPLVREALDTGVWSPVLLRLDDLMAEGGTPIRTVVRYMDAVSQALEHVEPQDDRERQVEDLSGWLYTSAEQAMFVGAHPGEQMIWRTQRDDRVRHTHAALEGESILPGSRFDVDGVGLRFPGDPIGPPSGWYNCRCYLEVASGENSLVAALEADKSEHGGGVIVALPADGDPVRDLGPEESHLTLVYVGDQDLTEDLEVAVGQYSRSLSERIDMAVTGVDQFGDEVERAQVLTLEPETASAVREGLLEILAAHGVEDASTWPEYRPHVTLGYIPEGEEPEDVEVPESIGFDRLAIWRGGDSIPVTFAMGSEPEVVDEVEPEAVEDPEPENEIEPSGPLMFHGVMVAEETETDADDGMVRVFQKNALTWREPPLTLTYEHIEQGMRTEVLGHLDRIWRLPDDPRRIAYEGSFDDSGDENVDIRIGQIANGTLGRVSIHAGATNGEAFEPEDGEGPVRVVMDSGVIASLAVVPMPGFADAYIALGPWPDDEPALEEPVEEEALVASAELQEWREKAPHLGFTAETPIENVSPETFEIITGLPMALLPALNDFKRGPGWVTDPVPTKRIHDYWTNPGQPGYAKIGWGTGGDFYRCRMHLAKYVDPRFLNRTCSQWHHDALGIWPGQHSAGGSMTASAEQTMEYRPPLEWFQDPQLDGPTPLHVGDDGRVYGHLADWSTCHISYGTRNCTTAPHSASNYSFFRLGKVLTDGGEVAVGQIVLGGPHSADGVSMSVTQDFYARTSAAVADVAVGEDRHGIWVAGAVRPWATPEQIYALRAAKLSGDWREAQRGQLELVAALAVNVPGFPIPEPSLVASGERILSLVAAGIVVDNSEVQEAEAAEALHERTGEVSRAFVARVAAEVDRLKSAREVRGEFRAMRAERARKQLKEII